MSSLLNDSPLVCNEPAANSETVTPLTLSVTEPLDPPPLKPVPAVTPVMSPTFVVNPESLLKPEMLISVLLSFLVASLSSTTTKKSPSASEVL